MEKNSFTLRNTGQRIYEERRVGRDEAPIVITGANELLGAANGAKIPVSYNLGSPKRVMP